LSRAFLYWFTLYYFYNMDNPTLLIIDDHSLLRDMWAKVLQESGQVSVIKYPGLINEALNIVREQKPSVILLDVYMSPISGFELVPIIKEHSPQTQIIGFSVHSNAAYAKQMLELGASGYVTKNCDIQTVLTAIHTVHKGEHFLTKEIEEIMSAF
jgi:DNA-binding NarL/FixJ family response regulator